MKRAACVLVLNDLHECLAVSRKDNPNDFGLPGGKVDEDETPSRAAIRECLEETGWKVGIIPAEPYVAIEGDTEVWTFLAHIPSGTFQNKLDEQETGVVKYVSPYELVQGSFKEYNEKMLQHFGVTRCYEVGHLKENGSGFVDPNAKVIHEIIFASSPTEAAKEFVCKYKGTKYVHSIKERP